MNAQSYHFSQFYSTPLLLNPAFTGYTDGPYRVAGNYRSQWGQAGSPYITSSLSIDFSPLRKNISEGNKIGFGISVLNDKTLGGGLQTNSIALSSAYNISLDQENIHTIGLGFQGVYHERRIDFSRLTFENQFGSNGFDPSLPIGELIESGKRIFFDLNIGSVYHFSLDDKSFFAGLGVYNVIKHKENIQIDEFKIPFRYTLLGGGQMDVGYAGVFNFSFNYQNQGAANEMTLGVAYGIQIGTEKKQLINFGVWHRIKDALIPYVGYQLQGFQVGFSYDYTISRLKTAGQIKNGFELSIVYTAEDKTELKRLIPWY
ncbi:MAG: PorP/SprF family type IX secretion system membrane protein [Bacteroidota bacterium]|nr:PorP/SprF family type IX secretion system membrane protein [Bacteroidota bacterium]